MQASQALSKLFTDYLENFSWESKPQGLYTPAQYLTGLGGKRLRPVLALMGAQACGAIPQTALDAGLAVELFHNFTLAHDDIMDNAKLRRNAPTLHEKWNVNQAILSGDLLFALSFSVLQSYDQAVYASLSQLLTQTAIEVCQGQQMDMEFEKLKEVTLTDYKEMIHLKTAVLVGAALKMGAITAQANEQTAQALYDFGVDLGIAFQLQDDYLDSFGDEESFGKRIGGDILEGKKTYLYIKALENANPEQRSLLLATFQDKELPDEKKIGVVQQIYVQTQAEQFLLEEIRQHTLKALQYLEKSGILEEGMILMKTFAEELMQRNK